MAGMEKRTHKEEVFHRRFLEQYQKNYRTQEVLAKELGVSRPTVAGWISGNSIPDILTLAKMAQLFHVSADYLLGLSDMASPDMSLRAAAEYTGLSEEAVECLHMGLDDFECNGVKISEEEKRQNRHIASQLIRNEEFTKMIHNLGAIWEAAYLERILMILEEKASNYDRMDTDAEFFFGHKEDRDVIASGVTYVLERKGFFPGESVSQKVEAMSDEELMGYVIAALMDNREQCELRQFHAAKAFSRYIDHVVQWGIQRAEDQFRR